MEVQYGENVDMGKKIKAGKIKIKKNEISKSTKSIGLFHIKSLTLFHITRASSVCYMSSWLLFISFPTFSIYFGGLVIATSSLVQTFTMLVKYISHGSIVDHTSCFHVKGT